ncbi:unnamed protein product [Vitrella brassicaformis CCMP3155]|uniref:Peptidylprolyl isomerase n=2 Tax=Vitrella brassicaformis TaxID=1169539 RepID=A0A0G4H4P0_VITBC|nr:unnamed protein product [Vitrella brassicaformis CCMP3155]|eukprot:CEM38758.1 unnamed protein product [Vitrella brassicaformis CCMP3155]
MMTNGTPAAAATGAATEAAPQAPERPPPETLSATIAAIETTAVRTDELEAWDDTSGRGMVKHVVSEGVADDAAGGRVRREGDGSGRLAEGSKVKVWYEAYTQDGSCCFSEEPELSRQGKQMLPATWSLGEGGKTPVFDHKVIHSMKEGEKCIVKLNRGCHAFYAGVRDKDNKMLLDPDTPIWVVLTLHEVVPPKLKQKTAVTFEGFSKDAEAFIKEGLRLCGERKYAQGEKAFNKVPHTYESSKRNIDEWSDEDRQKAMALVRRAQLNAAKFALDRYEREKHEPCIATAIKNTNKVLDAFPGDVKALYRRAKAHMFEFDLKAAAADIQAALAIEPTNADIRGLYNKIRDKIQGSRSLPDIFGEGPPEKAVGKAFWQEFRDMAEENLQQRAKDSDAFFKWLEGSGATDISADSQNQKDLEIIDSFAQGLPVDDLIDDEFSDDENDNPDKAVELAQQTAAAGCLVRVGGEMNAEGVREATLEQEMKESMDGVKGIHDDDVDGPIPPPNAEQEGEATSSTNAETADERPPATSATKETATIIHV